MQLGEGPCQLDLFWRRFPVALKPVDQVDQAAGLLLHFLQVLLFGLELALIFAQFAHDVGPGFADQSTMVLPFQQSFEAQCDQDAYGDRQQLFEKLFHSCDTAWRMNFHTIKTYSEAKRCRTSAKKDQRRMSLA